jgi:polysaccharide pyruvyl transferase WcaK-like protein
MMNIALLDTSAVTDNLGDEIIVDAVRDILESIVPNAYVYRLATHEYMTKVSRNILGKCEFAVVAGTNLMSSRMGSRHSLWKLRPWDVFALRRCILLGVGWREYMGPPDFYSAWMYKKILSNDFLHSARDRYTEEYLLRHDIRVVNTSCPTMWSLDASHCSSIPSSKASEVVTSLTYYKPQPVLHAQFLRLLLDSYSKVYFWPQQSDDFAYFQALGVSGIELIPPSVTHFDAALSNDNVDFIGARLHGGIRALQHGRRSLILKVDNRAAEIARTTNLPVENDGDLDAIKAWIFGDRPTEIALPTESIAAWKAQFARLC